MSLKKRILSVSRDLTKLDIDFHQRKKLIRRNYDFGWRLSALPHLLNSAIQEAKEKGHKGKKAYSFINKEIKEQERALHQTNDLLNQYPLSDLEF